jgi:hypothetical protein
MLQAAAGELLSWKLMRLVEAMVESGPIVHDPGTIPSGAFLVRPPIGNLRDTSHMTLSSMNVVHDVLLDVDPCVHVPCTCGACTR